jgi:hypothetical protein
MDTTDSEQTFRFEGTAFTSVESYQAEFLPAWLNPWRRRAHDRAIKRVAPAVYADGETYTEDRWSLTFRLTDVVLDDLGDRFKLGWEFTLRLRAADRHQARERAESFLDMDSDIADYTIRSSASEQMNDDTPTSA